jgi:hypothetical protein
MPSRRSCTTLVLLPRYAPGADEHPRRRCAAACCRRRAAFLSLRYMPLAEFTSIVLIAPLVVAVRRHRAEQRAALGAGGGARGA